MSSLPNISGHGDAGDQIVAMTLARAVGGANFLVSDSPICKPITTPERFNAIQPLIESQPYIGRFDVWRGEEIHYDAGSFRENGIKFGENLAQLHAKHAGIVISEEPWLKVEADERFRDKIVLNRSTRHRNDYFPWSEIVHHFPVEDFVFLGLKEEWVQFVNEFGVSVPYHPTKDLLECAKIIEAGKLYIGNQSSNINSAIGLGKRFVMECSLSSVDCVYRRPDSLYVTDGAMTLEVDGYAPLVTFSRIPERECDFSITPPQGYWHYQTRDGVKHKEVSGYDLLREVNLYERRNNLPISKQSDVANYMAILFPSFGTDSYTNHLIQRVNEIKQIVDAKQNEEIQTPVREQLDTAGIPNPISITGSDLGAESGRSEVGDGSGNPGASTNSTGDSNGDRATRRSSKPKRKRNVSV